MNKVETHKSDAVMAAWGKCEELCLEIADTVGPCAHWSDGNCGDLISFLKFALEKKGLYTEIPSETVGG